jgi:hypothetical protein
VQPAQAAEDLVWCSTPDMPKVDGLRSTSVPPHDGHVTDAVRENMSFSNSVWQLAQRNSKIGIDGRSWHWIIPEPSACSIGCCARPGTRRADPLVALSEDATAVTFGSDRLWPLTVLQPESV